MKLVVLDGPMRGRQFPLKKTPALVGRGASSQIRLLNDLLISRFQCQIIEEDEQFFVEDFGSANGTFIDDQRVENRTLLPPRTLLRVGNTHLCLLEDSAKDVPAGLLPKPEEPEDWLEMGEEGTRILERAKTEKMRIPDKARLGALAGKSLGPDASLNRLEKRLKIYEDLAQFLTVRMDRIMVFETVADCLLRFLPADQAFVLIPSRTRQTIRVAVTRTRGRASGQSPTPSLALPQAILKKPQPLLAQDEPSGGMVMLDESSKSRGIGSAMCVPLLAGPHVAAMFLLESRSPAVFTMDDVDLVQAVAKQTMLALGNATLYEKLAKAYQDLENAHDQAVQAEKLGAIGALTASIAHDMGNMLTPISIFTKRLMKTSGLEPKLQGALTRQVEKLKALTRQLLSFSKPQPLELDEVDLSQSIKECLSLVRTEARHKNVEIETHFAMELPKIRADRNRLEQVHVNIILNALQAMEAAGGQLVIKTYQEGSNVVAAFADTGPGIPAEHLNVIFQPFFTTKGSNGNGLGLFSCKRIVEEEHNGTIEAESKIAKGTTIRVRLPVANA